MLNTRNFLLYAHVIAMDFIQALHKNTLPQNVTTSIINTDETVRSNAKEQALESIVSLKSAGVKNSIIFYQICTCFTTLYVMGKLTLLDHKDLMKDYIAAIWPGDENGVSIIHQQLMIQMSIVKGQTSPDARQYINDICSGAMTW